MGTVCIAVLYNEWQKQRKISLGNCLAHQSLCCVSQTKYLHVSFTTLINLLFALPLTLLPHSFDRYLHCSSSEHVICPSSQQTELDKVRKSLDAFSYRYRTCVYFSINREKGSKVITGTGIYENMLVVSVWIAPQHHCSMLKEDFVPKRVMFEHVFCRKFVSEHSRVA